LPFKGQGLFSVRIHPVFWCVIVLSVWTGHFIEICTLFTLVIVHELGHLAAARSYGWKIASLQLLPFGGVILFDQWGTVDPYEEIVVSLAGPLQHLFLIMSSLFFYQCGWWNQVWTEYFIRANLLLAGFNLLPIYPLDGGRIVQALMSLYLPYRQALMLSYISSSLLAAFGIVLSFTNPTLVVNLSLFVIACFLLFTNVVAWKQLPYHYFRFLLARLQTPLSVKRQEIITLPLQTTLAKAVKRLYRQRYHLFHLVDQKKGIHRIWGEEVLLRQYCQRTFDK
jgi:stage IV sporulation protein FB